jgi:hypothetical protein
MLISLVGCFLELDKQRPIPGPLALKETIDPYLVKGINLVLIN